MTEEQYPWYVKTSRRNYMINLVVSFLVAITFILYRGFKLSPTRLILLLSFLGIFISTYGIMEYILTGTTIIRAKLPRYANTGMVGFFWFILYLALLLIMFFYPFEGGS